MKQIYRCQALRPALILALALVGAPTALFAASNYVSPFIITSLAGSPGTNGSTDGIGTAALFNNPMGAAVDANGNVYVADTANNTIRRVSPNGISSTFAGSPGQVGSADGLGSAARFYAPKGVAVDGSGNVYVADTGGQTIRKIAPNGGVATVAGLYNTPGSLDGTGSGARFFNPSAIAVDSLGNIYVADTGNSTIRKITAGVVSTIGGSPTSFGYNDGASGVSLFNGPAGVAVDANGNVYVADTGNDVIRNISIGGIVSTIAGSAGVTGSSDGTGSAALFNAPQGVTVDVAGNVYVLDTGNQTIREILAGGIVTTLAGKPGTSGSTPGTGPAARFNHPTSVSVDINGNLYVADAGNQTIRKGSPSPAFTTISGSAGAQGSTDGPALRARYLTPNGIAVDSTGDIFLTDTYSNTVRVLYFGDDIVSTIAGTAGIGGSADANAGQAIDASFLLPSGIAITGFNSLLDGTGSIYVADTANNTIRLITPSTVSTGGVQFAVSTFAGEAPTTDANTGITTYHTGYLDGQVPFSTNPVTQVKTYPLFYNPTGLAVDANGTLYIADTGNNVIRIITANDIAPTQYFVSTLAGTPGQAGSRDGSSATAQFTQPQGVAVDSNFNVYVADTGNDTIRKISTNGAVTTLAGSAGLAGSIDGSGSAARFNGPTNLTLDGNGNLYVTDSYNNTLREITPTGLVTTLGGTAGTTGSTDGTGTSALFSQPKGVGYVLLNGTGNILVADYGNRTIRYGAPPVAPTAALDPFGGSVVAANLKYSLWFGYYAYATYPLVYEYNLGYEYAYPITGGIFLYDYTSGHFWYTQSNYFPFIYDFSLQAYLYYYENGGTPRYFYDFGTGQLITL